MINPVSLLHHNHNHPVSLYVCMLYNKSNIAGLPIKATITCAFFKISDRQSLKTTNQQYLKPHLFIPNPSLSPEEERDKENKNSAPNSHWRERERSSISKSPNTSDIKEDKLSQPDTTQLILHFYSHVAIYSFYGYHMNVVNL